MKARGTEVDKQQKEEYFVTSNKEITKDSLNLTEINELENILPDDFNNTEDVINVISETLTPTKINKGSYVANNELLESMQESIKNIETKLETDKTESAKDTSKTTEVTLKKELSYYLNYSLMGLLIPSMVNSCTYAMLFLITKPFTEIATEVTMSWLTLTMATSYFLAIAFTFFYSLKHSIKLAFNHKADVKLKVASGFSILLSVLLPIFPILGTILAWNIFGNLINMTVLVDTQGIVIDNLGQLFGMIQSSSFVDLYVYLNNFLTTICFMEPGDILTFEYIKSQL
jgi:hypothetical protein